MSWIAGLAGKAEDLLNKIDQSTATVLQKDEKPGKVPSATDAIDGQSYSPYLSKPSSAKSPATRPDSLSPISANSPNNLSYSGSVPVNLHQLENNSHSSRSSKRTPTSMPTPGGSGSARQSPVRNPKRDKDEELFEFLNSKDKSDSNSNGKKKVGSLNSTKSMLNGGHSRESSGSSTTSTPTGNKTPEPPAVSISVSSCDNTPSDKSVNGLLDSAEQTSSSSAGDDIHGNPSTEPSSGYISDGGSGSGHVSSLELENRLLKNEVTQLNQEMTSVISRAKDAHEELSRCKRKFDTQSHQTSRSDQVIRELHSQEADFHEALSAKDSQLAILRVRLEEADKELASQRSVLHQLKQEKNRILQDHTSASGVQGQALDSLKSKLHEADVTLQREQNTLRKIQQEAMNRQSSLESEKHHLSQEVSALQRKGSEEKGKYSELTVQLKSAKLQVDLSKQELTDYKEKATRILQSKDKLIASLKEGAGLGGGDGAVSAAELEEMRQERDMFKEEMQRSQMTVESLRTEISDLEMQLQQDSDAAADQISSLEEQHQTEKERREDAEQEINRQKQELRYAHEELLKQKTAFQSRIQDREIEIERLRSQLTNKSMSTSSEAELENRLHALTESLIQKQTMLEALSTEKNSLVLQLERMERQYREAESSALRATSTAVNMNEEEEVRNRLPLFMRESPLDGDVTRKVKRAANSIDRFSMKLGVFLRRYPMARIFVILYMVLLHLWVSVVLLTYKPEMHGADYQPKPPGSL